MKKIILLLALVAAGAAFLGCDGDDGEDTPAPIDFDIWAITYRYASTTEEYHLVNYNKAGSQLKSFSIPYGSDITYLSDNIYTAHYDRVLKINPADGQVLGSYRIPEIGSNSVSGMANDGRTLRLLVPDKEVIYKLNTSYSVVSSIPTIHEDVSSLTYDNGHLWYYDRENKKLIKARDSDGNVVNEYYYLSGLYGLGYDGENLWGFDRNAQEKDYIKQVNPATGETVREFTPLPWPTFYRGLTVHRKY